MDTFLTKLEYTQIIQIIKSYCKTYLGKKQCTALLPSFELQTVENLLEETNEAFSLLHQKGSLPVFELEELETYIKILESNQTLSLKGLLALSKFLQLSSGLHSYFYQDENFDLLPFSHLAEYFSNIYCNPSIEKNIASKILDENTIADDASSKLFSLRKNRKNLESQVKDKLNSYIHSSNYAKYIMDPIVTIRNNRYVIPVKEEYREMIKGFVHDTSSSGSTLYMEPMAVFELNNQMNHIKMEEEIEIQKILQVLSATLFPYTAELKQNLELVGKLDLIFAKALYGKTTDGVIPNVTSKKMIDFYKARHPLLDTNVAVPIDISLGKDYDCLLITGPNTGGKTVALKTIGLLLLMAYSGIPIPCSEKSSICVFSNIFVDVGDEQSIEQNLSTFSAHMKNIIRITNDCNRNSLALLDELGSGTDPLEGAALAISILDFLKNNGCLICATTHYPELKEYALVTTGFENASFEFDLENLKPTYRLLLGIPGKSNAFEISKKLGLSSSILDDAVTHLKEDKISIEELLKNIYEDKLTIEKEKEEIEKNLNQITGLRQSLEQEKYELTSKKKALLDKAKSDARDIVLDAKEEVNHMIQSLSKEQISLKDANGFRDKLNKKMKELAPTENLIASSNTGLDATEIKEGLTVWIPSLQSSGNIVSTHVNKSNEVLVQLGLLKMNLKLDQLSKMQNEVSNVTASKVPSTVHTAMHSNTHSTVHTTMNSKAQTILPEINVIGQNVDEAIYVIDKYMDNCALAHLSPIRIVHGKGTGKLREGIHKYLKTNSHVKSFRLGTFGEGEMGVTVVELK